MGFFQRLRFEVSSRWYDWRLERSERARLKREEREVAKLAAVEAKELARAQAAGRRAKARESVQHALLFGFPAKVAETLRTRKLAVLSVVLLMALSAAAGALYMRARHRNHLTGTLVAVNGVVIRRDQFYDDLVERHGSETLQRLVERELRTQFIRAHGAEATNQQVDQRLRIEENSPEFHALLDSLGVSEPSYRESLKRVLSEINLISQGVEVTEDEVRAFYRRNADPRNMRALFYTPPRVTIAVIATPTQALAQKAAAALKAGEPFPSVAARYSIHDSVSHGGIVGPFYLGRSMTAVTTGLDALARMVDDGQQIGPIKRGGVWWIVRCLKREPAVTRSYDEVKDTARLLARFQKGVAKNKERLDKEYDAFRKKANIQRFAAR